MPAMSQACPAAAQEMEASRCGNGGRHPLLPAVIVALLLALLLASAQAGAQSGPAAAEVAAAKEASDRAFERYTRLATAQGAAPGERDAAMAEYRAALARYRALQAAMELPAQRAVAPPSPPSEPAAAAAVPRPAQSPAQAVALTGVRIEMGGSGLRAGQAQLRALQPDATNRADGLAGQLVELGLGAPVAAPVSVELDLERGDGGQVMLGVGTEFRRDDGSRFVHFRFLPAEATAAGGKGRFVPAEFDGRVLRLAGGGSAQPIEARRYRLGLFTRTVSQRGPGALFAVTHPRKLGQDGSEFLGESDLDLLFSDLEQIYRQFQDPLKYQYERRKSYPLQVHLSDLGSLDGAYDYNLLTGIDGSSISLNRRIFAKGYRNGRIKARTVFTHEFFHFVQHNYTSGSHSSDWFDEASSTYYEWVEAQGKVSVDVLQTHWTETYRGMLPATDSAIAGYARMPLLQYLTRRKGDSFIRQVYARRPQDHAAWASAIASVSGLQPEQYVSDYYLALLRQDLASWYAAGSIYRSLVYDDPAVPDAREVGRALVVTVPEPATVKDKVDAGERIVLARSTMEIEALGARLVALSVSMPADRSGLAEDAALELSVDGAGELRILQLTQGGQVEHSLAGLRIERMKNRFGHGYTYLAVVSSTHPRERRALTLRVAFDGGKAKTPPARIARLVVDDRAETDPGDNAMTYLHNAIVHMGRLDLVYRNETEFEVVIPAFDGSLSNGYDTERYSFPGMRLSGTITPGKYDRQGNFGSVQGSFRASSTTTDQRGSRYSLQHEVRISGSIYRVNAGVLTLRLQGEISRSGSKDPDRPVEKTRASKSIRFTHP